MVAEQPTVSQPTHCVTKQPVILIDQAAHDWAIEKLPGSHHWPLLGKVKTAGQSCGFRASSGGSLQWQLQPPDSHLTVTFVTHSPLELGTWNCYTMFTTCHVTTHCKLAHQSQSQNCATLTSHILSLLWIISILVFSLREGFQKKTWQIIHILWISILPPPLIHVGRS